MMSMPNDEHYEGVYRPIQGPAESAWAEIPTATDPLHCLFCHSPNPHKVHLLDAADATFRDGGDEYVLPKFAALCSQCDNHFENGEDEVLAALLDQVTNDDQGEQFVNAFRRATRESRVIH
jgi:hypothetical protein